jgi:hypothetical protein
MERTYTFTVLATIEDAATDLDDSDDEAIGEAENNAVEAARTVIMARYATVEALLNDAEVAEDLDY